MNNNPPSAPTGTGYIIVNVTTANQAIPLENATVYVYEYDLQEENQNRGGLITVEQTNMSGTSPIIPLPAPSRSESMAPGGIKPYTTYNLDVIKDGYYNQSYINVPVFDGITAIQNVDLIPLSDNSLNRSLRYNDYTFFESENKKL